MKTILVTGGAGFIGMHTTLALLAQGHAVISLDNLNDYYDVQLKRDRLAHIDTQAQDLSGDHTFVEGDLADIAILEEIFTTHPITHVCNLGAQAGVRYSIDNPQAYIQSNLQGFANILEQCRHHDIAHLVYASSSSVYGKSTAFPYAETSRTDAPVSLYAATKKSNEVMAHAYAHLYGIPMTGLRFFTVYGPWGRPDMAYFSFTQKILAGETIDVFNHGKLSRDFTYIDDIVEGIVRILDKLPVLAEDGKTRNAIYNIGNNEPVELMTFIETIEQVVGKTAEKNLLPMQAGDVYATHANIDQLQAAVNFSPKTPLRDGLAHFYDWYRQYYG